MPTEAFYWDMNDQTRAWSKRFFDKIGRMPTMVQAVLYSALVHYSELSRRREPTLPVLQKMRDTKINDFFATNVYIRKDGRHVHDMYLFQVKAPEEPKGPWDYYKLIATIKGKTLSSPSKGASVRCSSNSFPLQIA